MESNVRASPGYSKPDPMVLINSPDWLRKHIIQRLNSTLSKQDADTVSRVELQYKVRSESRQDVWHTVTMCPSVGYPSCTCYDWQKHKVPCKHMCVLLKDVEEVSWDCLPEEYRCNPVFTLDNVVLGQREVPNTENQYPSDTEDREERDAMHEERDAMHDLPHEPNENITDLPWRKRAKRKLLIRKCVAQLKEITDMVYNLKDEDYLQDLAEELSSVRQQTFLQVPCEDGLQVLETPKKSFVTMDTAKSEAVRVARKLVPEVNQSGCGVKSSAGCRLQWGHRCPFSEKNC